MQPLSNQVIIRPDPEAETYEGSLLYIPDVCRDKVTTGTVVAAGPGRWTEYGHQLPMTVQEGDRVLYTKFNGLDIGDGLVTMIEAEIVAILTDD